MTRTLALLLLISTPLSAAADEATHVIGGLEWSGVSNADIVHEVLTTSTLTQAGEAWANALDRTLYQDRIGIDPKPVRRRGELGIWSPRKMRFETVSYVEILNDEDHTAALTEDSSQESGEMVVEAVSDSAWRHSWYPLQARTDIVNGEPEVVRKRSSRPLYSVYYRLEDNILYYSYTESLLNAVLPPPGRVSQHPMARFWIDFNAVSEQRRNDWVAAVSRGINSVAQRSDNESQLSALFRAWSSKLQIEFLQLLVGHGAQVEISAKWDSPRRQFRITADLTDERVRKLLDQFSSPRPLARLGKSNEPLVSLVTRFRLQEDLAEQLTLLSNALAASDKWAAWKALADSMRRSNESTLCLSSSLLRHGPGVIVAWHSDLSDEELAGLSADPAIGRFALFGRRDEMAIAVVGVSAPEADEVPEIIESLNVLTTPTDRNSLLELSMNLRAAELEHSASSPFDLMSDLASAARTLTPVDGHRQDAWNLHLRAAGTPSGARVTLLAGPGVIRSMAAMWLEAYDRRRAARRPPRLPVNSGIE